MIVLMIWNRSAAVTYYHEKYMKYSKFIKL